jgi:serine protease Do
MDNEQRENINEGYSGDSYSSTDNTSEGYNSTATNSGQINDENLSSVSDNSRNNSGSNNYGSYNNGSYANNSYNNSNVSGNEGYGNTGYNNGGYSNNNGYNGDSLNGANNGGYSNGSYNSGNYNNGNHNNNNYNNGNYNNNGYNNGYGNGNGAGGGSNGNKKWPKILAAACAVFIIGSMFTGIYFTAKGLLDQAGQEVSSDDVAWNDEKPDSAKKEEVKTAEDKPIATTQPVSVAQSGAAGAGVSDVSGIVEEVMPCVVQITSTQSVKGYSIFGQEYEQEVSGGGTGFIVGKNENELLIATNNHVVAKSSAIQITFIDESTAEAVVKGSDANADLAVVSVKLDDIKSDTMDKIKVSVLGDSDKVKVGQMAIVIGNARGMGQSVTVGYISAKDREIEIQDENTGKKMKMHYLQTDAAINGGNSGGPLLDVNGNVVGISSAKIVDTQVEAMCYAIPISNAIPIINELMNRETLADDEKGYIGVSLADIDSSIVEKYGVPAGAYVGKVTKDSPAEKAGIEEGDIITKINDTETTTSEAATSKITSLRAGTEVTVTVCRQSASGHGYEEKEFKVTLVTAKELGINTNKTDKNEDSSEKDKKSDQDRINDYYDDFNSIFPW